jgi:hypothetical protein
MELSRKLKISLKTRRRTNANAVAKRGFSFGFL